MIITFKDANQVSDLPRSYHKTAEIEHTLPSGRLEAVAKFSSSTGGQDPAYFKWTAGTQEDVYSSQTSLIEISESEYYTAVKYHAEIHMGSWINARKRAKEIQKELQE